MRATALVILSLLASPAPAAESTVSLNYEAYAHGLPVMRMFIFLHEDGHSYQMRLNYQTIGLARFLFAGDQWDQVNGIWDEAGPVPRSYQADGVWGGKERHALLEYHKGMPETRTMEPPLAEEREPVPPAERTGTIDPLSGILRLIRQVQTSARCDTSGRTFDGRRLTQMVVQTGPKVTLDRTGRSGFYGPALECDFTGQMIGGFLKDRDHKAPPHPMHGAAWLAQITPGGPPVPVRLRFETRWLGDVTMYLTSTVPDQHH